MNDEVKEVTSFENEETRSLVTVYEYKGFEIYFNYYCEYEYMITDENRNEWWYATLDKAVEAIERMINNGR